ncbi:MAG TPA: ABC transporter permease [Vicinamibacterales bacterium]|jgi:ABC-2 type transport system permease protein
MTIALRSLLKLTWIEIKIFAREPLGLFGSLLIPLIVFFGLARFIGPNVTGPPRSGWPGGGFLPVLTTVLMALSAVSSLITIVSIYREGGILKRLRATPLQPPIILSTHVIVKLLFTGLTMFLMFLAGRRYFPPGAPVPYVSFGVAVLFATWAILSLGFVIASLVPTARFAQPIATFILYPMVVLSGLFFPIAALPPLMQWLAKLLPLSYAVSLLSGIWRGDAWSAHMLDVAALVATFLVCTAVSSRVFRWE